MNLKRILQRSTFVILIASFLLSCGSSQRVVRKPATTEAIGFEKMIEDFNPMALNDDEIEIDQPEGLNSDFDDIFENQVAMKDTIGSGFRIQIIQTTDADEAKSVQREATFRFDEGVYRIFNPPFHKIRIGDFVNWREAEKLQELAIKKGYRDAWIIQTKVNLKNAYKWIDEL